MQYGISHTLQSDLEKEQFLTRLLEYFTDAGILHASVCIDVYSTLTNLTSLENYVIENSLCTFMHKTINTLISFIRRFLYILKDTPQSFLQYVLNESKDERLSSKATALLKTRYMNLAYFETEESGDDAEKVINRLLTEEMIWDFDVSPSEDYLMCVYLGGLENVEIQLFSIPNFESIWKQHVKCICHSQTLTSRSLSYFSVRPRNIAFHPSKDNIFPGRLDSVLTLGGILYLDRSKSEERLQGSEFVVFQT